jgi:hypothetical protein
MILPFDPVPIIELEPFGYLSTPTICKQMKTESNLENQ